MEGILKVTPEKLVEASGTFATTGSQIQNLTNEMMSLVTSLNSIWQGEAAGAFAGKFKQLQTDMDKLYRMIEEHAEDLQEMAEQYRKAESGNAEQGNGLQSGVVV